MHPPITRVADPGCLSRIRICSIPDSGSKRFLDPDPHASKTSNILTPKNFFQALGNIHPTSGSWFFYHSRIQGWKRHRIPDPQICLYLKFKKPYDFCRRRCRGSHSTCGCVFGRPTRGSRAPTSTPTLSATTGGLTPMLKLLVPLNWIQLRTYLLQLQFVIVNPDATLLRSWSGSDQEITLNISSVEKPGPELEPPEPQLSWFFFLAEPEPQCITDLDPVLVPERDLDPDPT